MAHAEDHAVEPTPARTLESQKQLYKSVMDFTMTAGLPIGLAIAMFVALLLMQVGIPVSLFLSFMTWLGVLAFSKMFLVH